MRWVCKDDIEECLTQQWRDLVAEALSSLEEAETSEERKKILKKAASSNIWRKFYALLPESLKKKCWYCEAEEIRSDMPVDHFRPKNKLEGDNEHEGYWWLAFQWDNYRCACTYCNSRRVLETTDGGKACKFPIVDPSKRVRRPDEDIQEEEPDFLDPFDPDDWKLLWFDGDGIPVSKPNCNEDEKRKVENSIDIFHLHETRLVRARNKIRISVEKKIVKLKEAKAEGDALTVREVKRALMKMTRDSEKLSLAAIVYLRAHRNIEEVKEILEL